MNTRYFHIAIVVGLCCLPTVSCKKGAVVDVGSNDSTDRSAKLSRDPIPQDGNVATSHATSEFAKYVTIANTDIERALRLLRQEVAVSDQDRAKVALLNACGKADMEAIPLLADSIQNARLRERALRAVAFNWADRSPERLFAFAAQKMSGENRNLVMHEAVQGEVRRGRFASARGMIEAMPFSDARLDAIGDLAAGYSGSDVDGAVQWAKTLTSSEDRDRAYLCLLGNVAEHKGLAGLNEVLLATNNLNIQMGCVNEAVKLVARDDNAMAAQNWVSSLPPNHQGPALTGLIDAMANSDFMDWGTSALALSNDHDKASAVSALAYRWTPKAPYEAAEWAVRLPSSVRNAALGAVIGRWYEIDSEQLLGWINVRPPGADRDYMLQHLAYRIKNSDGQGALELANQIGDQWTKKRVLADLKR